MLVFRVILSHGTLAFLVIHRFRRAVHELAGKGLESLEGCGPCCPMMIESSRLPKFPCPASMDHKPEGRR